MRVVVIVQARMGSSRLPGKVLLPIGGRSMLAHVVARCRAAAEVDAIVIATTTEAGDDGLIDAAAALDVQVVRGPRDDVLERYRLAAEASDADLIVRVTADCPLLEPAEIDRLVRRWHARAAEGVRLDWLSNQLGERRRIPRGLDVEVVPRDALERAAAAARDAAEREHVTPYFYRDPTRSRVEVSDRPGADHSALRLTVDDARDLALVRGVVERLGDHAPLAAVAALLAAEPTLRALNAGVAQKAALAEDELRAARIGGRLLVGRADAGAAIGVGHVARVFCVLEAWVEAGGHAALVGRGVAGAFAARCAAAGVVVVDAAAAEVRAAAVVAATAGAVACVVDSYAIDAAAFAAIAAGTAGPVLAVDDLGGPLKAADLVLHQGSVEGARALYGAGPHAFGLLAGPAYLLIRRELRAAIAAAAPRAPAAPPGRVLVTLGGADVGGFTLPVTEALLARAGLQPPAVDVLVGPAAPEALGAALDALAAREPTLRVLRDVRDMAAALAAVDLAVSAAGSTAWELAALGTPAVLVIVADNQRGVADCVAAAGCAVVVDPRGDAAADPGAVAALADAAFALLDDEAARADAGRRGRALVDGRGALRVIDALLTAIEESAT